LAEMTLLLAFVTLFFYFYRNSQAAYCCSCSE